MRALVTGGAGFIGSTLVDRLLASGHAVDVLDDLSTGRLDNLAEARSDRAHEITFSTVDVRGAEVPELIARRSPEVIFHLAGRAGADAATDAEIGVVGTLRVLEGARLAGARKVVFASSAGVYGSVEAELLPVREGAPQRPVSLHGVAKKAAFEYLCAFREQWGVEFTALALATVYGPRQVAPGVVPSLLARLRAGEACVVAGDGAQTRDLVYVDDVVDALVRAAERGGGLLVNVGTGVETSVGDLLRALAAAAGVSAPAVAVAPVPAGERRRVALDPGRARIHLGWSPWTSLEDGLREVVRFGGRS
ncbi:MAG TPA: NAD-dependent epimerase/dehydratase family protein [Acidimicrobiales bacterium]|nr:NAD-dependent epimerase/dehydratase family protein [Acidimicrobiales bacterium]